MARLSRAVILACTFLLSVLPPVLAQAPQTPERLPFRFSNFVWWTDSELRALLKRKLPNVPDEIPPTMSAESKIRTALLQLLRQKGISGEVVIADPSPAALRGPRDLDVPPPAITFSLTSPRVFVDRLIILNAPGDLQNRLYEYLNNREGKEYASADDWIIQSTSAEELARNSYLEGKVEVSHDAPRRQGDHYLVNLLVNVTPGPQYHIARLDGDGGPLLAGRDLSHLFAGRPGDLATPDVYGRLAAQIRSLYYQYGFADAEVTTARAFDREHALVSYHLKVSTGPQYHLRALTIHGLKPDVESHVHQIFSIKPGDIFEDTAITNLYRTLSSDPALAGMSFSYGPKKDKSTGSVDLTLDFFKSDSETHVTVN